MTARQARRFVAMLAIAALALPVGGALQYGGVDFVEVARWHVVATGAASTASEVSPLLLLGALLVVSITRVAVGPLWRLTMVVAATLVVGACVVLVVDIATEQGLFDVSAVGAFPRTYDASRVVTIMRVSLTAVLAALAAVWTLRLERQDG